MSLKNKRINLADSFYKKEEKTLKRQKTLIIISPAICVVIALAGIYGGILVKTNNLKNNTQDLKNDISELKIQQQETLQLEAANKILSQDMENLNFAGEEKTLLNGRNIYFEKSLFSNIEKCGNSKLKISGCMFSGGIMNLTVTSSSKDPLNISEFVRNLKGLEYFKDVSYTGYTGGEEYTVNITCVFN